jgi:hypothetical protein
VKLSGEDTMYVEMLGKKDPVPCDFWQMELVRRPVRSSDPNAALFSAFQSLQSECFDLFQKKQLDYGPGNISDGWNGFGPASLLIRMNDKMQRMIHLNKTGANPNNESLVDSLNDIANYAMIMRLCLSGQWPGVKGE